ncbi:hypothetical protein [Streptomyces sp. NPDC006551]|uniref:hypothetical protein n=1 Tax=Streptomyces sp. NPDC006551 TaxID=3157178 RepID=UPI00339E26EE
MTDVTDDVFAATVPAEEPTKPGRGRRLLTAVLPAVLVLGVIGGGVTYTGVTVAAADRSAPTVVWEAGSATEGSDPAAGIVRGKASTPLSKLLLPVPEGYSLGPDIETYGNDGELGGKEAAALVKREGKGLSGKKRREYEKEVDRLGVQGIAVRSFVSDENDVVVDVTLMRMKDKKQIGKMFQLRKEIADLLEFPKGPKISGHKNAVCYVMPELEGLDKKEKAKQLEGMVCIAYDSENLVAVTAAGAKPFDRSAVAALVKKQLDHIKSPGEYV